MTAEPRDWPYPGARWWKFDFHTHTPASSDTRHWQDAIGTPDEITPDKWLFKYMAAGIHCVAVTDHNSGGWIDRLKSAYAAMQANPPESFHELHLFPGVEISVSSGLHLLAVFDQDKSSDTITHLLGAVGFPEHLTGETNAENEAACTRESLVKVVEEIHRRGGIAIPAHADSSKGLLQTTESTNVAEYPDEIRSVLQSGLLAIEVVDRNVAKPTLYCQSSARWSEVVGSDCHNFRNGDLPGSRYTWVKMATPSLEGLRLALMDGEGFSIRRSDDPLPFNPYLLPEHFIESIEISDARCMGRGHPATLTFNPWFNAIIGGRGTGKSTVIHMARLALRREGELNRLDNKSEPRVTFEGFYRVAKNRTDAGGLQENTAVTLTLMRDGVRHFLHWRQSGQGVVVEEESANDWQACASQSVTPERFPVRIFSQGQIAALADEGQQALLGVIDEAAGTVAQQSALEEARRKFLALRAQIRELDGQLEGVAALTVQLEDVQRKLRRFEETHHAEILKSYQRRNRQRREVERQFETAAEMAASIETLAETLQSEDLPEGLFDAASTEDETALAVVAALAGAVQASVVTVRDSAQRLRTAVDVQRAELAKTAWQVTVDKAVGDYQTLIDILKEQGVTDPSEYGRLVQERQRLDGETKRLASLRDQRDRLKEQAQAQLEKVLTARRAVSQTRQDFLERALAQNPFVRIELLPYGRDPVIAERLLRQVLGIPPEKYNDAIYTAADGDQLEKGLIADLYRNLADDPTQATAELEQRLQNLRERLTQACTGSSDFGVRFSKFLLAETGKRPELVDHLLTWFPEDALQVQYSRSGDGMNFQSITQASAGQRAAAMLAFLLAHGQEPLILDQPEDDLDNHLIYDLVVRQIRENKQRRQIIVVTHNPNIVVNGDAEMLHALDFAGGQCRVAQSGSLQEKPMREEVCRVMEGGREAFERRYRRLGQKVGDV